MGTPAAFLGDPRRFRAALTSVPPGERDAWVDHLFGLGELPDDGGDLPRGGVPYLPCPVETLLKVVDRVPVGASDSFVDVGAGVGRAMALVHLLSGATVLGLEVQPGLVRAARGLLERLQIPRATCLEGDAATLPGLEGGSVFFFYCPFSGERLDRALARLEHVARTRVLGICCVDLPLPPRPWLSLEESAGSLAIYRSHPPR